MSGYLVLERKRRGGAADFTLLRDRFAWLAFLFPLFWALFHRLWLEALAILAIGAVIGALGSWDMLANFAPGIGLAAMFLFGLEANSVRAAALRRRGFADWGVVEAENAADAELRYIAERHGDEIEAASAPEMPTSRPSGGGTSKPGAALGLLGYGQGR
jgi:hypothetical protein